ncbi:putrescine transport system permease protein PotH [Caedimonas varicaedens]|jgi:putrescine transport system permease protein|uniref:Putrescine transport system permease protein PotH n=1 Tax=Caedimonas varicaedens TaxID=1629334 RepID=A0A0K8MEA5_9PROT|nr:putrescine transport system permease protein PotH [Caedimonas varicaedens]
MNLFTQLFKKIRLDNFFGRALVIALPYGWHILFFLVPFMIVLGLSFSEGILSSPPYTPLYTWVDESFLQIRLNFANYLTLFEDDFYFGAYIESLKISAISTFFCLIVAYPMAYGIARASPRQRTLLLMLVILPFWTSFLIRVYSWIGLLSNQGLLNSFLLYLGIIKQPLSLLNTHFAVILGIVYSYLPFMIFPLYATLQKMDPQILEAASDLGCKPVRTFFTITVPLSMRGAIAGSMLVFIPAVGEFVIPELLGGSDTLMIGKVLWIEFFTHRDWPMASALAVALLTFLVLPIIAFQKLIIREEEGI